MTYAPKKYTGPLCPSVPEEVTWGVMAKLGKANLYIEALQGKITEAINQAEERCINDQDNEILQQTLLDLNSTFDRSKTICSYKEPDGEGGWESKSHKYIISQETFTVSFVRNGTVVRFVPTPKLVTKITKHYGDKKDFKLYA